MLTLPASCFDLFTHANSHKKSGCIK